MSVQRIGFIERNIEKILVAVAGAGLVGVLAWQFAGPRTTVDVDTKRGVALNDVYPELAKMANNLNSAMTRTGFTDKPELPKTGSREQFDRILAGDASAAKGAGFGNPGSALPGVDGAIKDEPAGATVFRAPRIDAPTPPKALAFLQTVSSNEVDNAVKDDPAAAKLFPAKAPFDKAAVSVQTSFDGAKLREVFEAAPTDPKNRQIPKSLWDSTQIARVQLERQEQGADGQWSDPVTVPPMPGRFTLVPQLAGKAFNAGNSGELIKTAGENEDAILRPAFYDRAILAGKPVGEAWEPPAEANAGGNNIAAQGAKLRRQIDDKDREIRQLEIQVTNLKTPNNRPAPGGGGGGGGAGRSPRGGGGGGGGSGSAAPPKTNTHDEQIKRLEEILKKKRDERIELVEKLKQLGQPVAQGTKKNAADIAISRLLQDNDVRIWSHDVSVARGKTYRYRVRLWFTNPLVGQGARMDPAENAMALDPVIAGKESEWSDPVKVDDDSYYFITSTTPAGTKGTRGASAGAELYMFTWGYWRKGQNSLEPGDAVAARVKIPDVEAIEKIVPAAGGDNPQPFPGALPPGGGGGGGSKGANPLGPGPGREAAPGVGPAGVKPPPGVRAPEPALVDLGRDAFLVDVVTSAVSDRDRKSNDAAYVRDATGQIIVRQPDSDRAMAEYKRVSESAAAGDEQIRNILEPADAPPAPMAPPMPGPGGRPQPGRSNPNSPGGGFGG
ncbi:MAG: hypothetical protein ACREJO_02235 [Phycisphaerales bacterium]